MMKSDKDIAKIRSPGYALISGYLQKRKIKNVEKIKLMEPIVKNIILVILLTSYS